MPFDDIDPNFKPSFNKATPLKGIPDNFIEDLSEPLIVLHQGARKGGKGVSVFGKAVRLKKKGVLIEHVWSARSNENLYWMINKNCRDKYKKMKIILNGFKERIESLKKWSLDNGLTEKEYDFYIDILVEEKMIRRKDKSMRITSLGLDLIEGRLLHCECHNRHKVLWVVPDYVEFVEETVWRFNGWMFKDLEEYKSLLRTSEITKEEKKMLLDGRLPKPEHLRPDPILKIVKITPPLTALKQQVFQNQYLHIMLQARAERRVIVMNPSMFEGKVDKFVTIAEIVNLHQFIMNKSGHFMPKDKKDIHDVYDESWHKACIVINELRSVAPSSKLSPEAKSGLSKKAIVDFIPEARHYKTWFLADLQQPDDLYGGVRFQTNYFVIKRASAKLLGEDWNWLFDQIDNQRKQIHYHEFPSLPIKHPRVQTILDRKRPIVSELPDNLEYVTNINNDIILQQSPLPDFHLKTSLEDFRKDSGLVWYVNQKIKPNESEDSDVIKTPKINKKAIKVDLATVLKYKYEVEKKEWDVIEKEVKVMDKFNILGLDNKDWKYFSNWYGRNKELAEKIKQ